MSGRSNLSSPRSPAIEFDEDDYYPDEVEEEEEAIEIDCEEDSHVSNESSQRSTVCSSKGSSGDVSVESMTKELEALKSPSNSSHPSSPESSTLKNVNNSSNSIEGEQPSASGVGAFSGRAVRIPLRSITGEVKDKKGETNKNKESKNDQNQHGSNSDWAEKTRDWFKKNISMSSSSSSSHRPTFPLTSGTTIVKSNPSFHPSDSQAVLPSSSIIQQQQGGSSSNASDGENLTPPPPQHRPFYFPSNSSDIILNREENRHEGRFIGGHNTYQTIVKKKKVTSSVRVFDPFGSNYAYKKTSCTTSKVTKLAPFSRSSPTPPPQSLSSGSNSETLLFKEPKVPTGKTRKRRTIAGESENTSTSRMAIQGSNNLSTTSENQTQLTLRDGTTSKNKNNVTNTLNRNFRGRQGTRRVTMAPSYQPPSKRCKPSTMNNLIESDSSPSSSTSSSDIPLGATAESYAPESRNLRELKPRLGRSMKHKEFLTSTPVRRGFRRRPTPHPPSFRRRLQFEQEKSEDKPINKESSTSPSSESEGNNENDNNDNASSDASAENTDLSDRESEKSN